MSSPRSRLYTRLLLLVSVLWAAGFVLVCVRVRVLSRRVAVYTEVFDSRLASFDSEIVALRSRPVVSSAPSESPSVQESVEVPKFRVMGSGVLSRWRYTDVRFPDNTTFRYYSVRGDSSSASNVALRVLADAAEHQSMQETDGMPIVE